MGVNYCLLPKGETNLMVDGKPYLILGGELHNSSGSSLSYLKEEVWPVLRQLGGNCYLTPVYWECMEPEQGTYDFTLVDGVIEQAREEGVRLVLLWFGLWKNGRSTYAPSWIKEDPAYFYMRGQDGRLVESVSPLCRPAVEADRKAFSALMEHLKEIDLERTVIMVQVENEVGIWGHPRDYSPEAETVFQQEIPEEMAELDRWAVTKLNGLIEKCFAWSLARAVGEIAQAGKEAYPLPLFMNCVPDSMRMNGSKLAGGYPSGGPVPHVQDIWRKMAPAVDLYGPDIYDPNYQEISTEFAEKNALVVPELGGGKDAASKALFTVAAFNTICFSPFGIEGMMRPNSEQDLLSTMNIRQMPPLGRTGEYLAEAYRLLQVLWPEMKAAQKEERIWAFLQGQGRGEEFVLKDFVINVGYGAGRPPMPGMPGSGRIAGEEEASAGGGFLIQYGEDEFFICGVSCQIDIKPRYGSQEQIFVREKRELLLTEEGFVAGRILNDDERNYLAFGSRPSVQRVSFYRREELTAK